MDPLGVTAPIVDALSLPRWSTTPVPSYEIMPSNSRRTENPFPVRQDLNSKVALWWVFMFVVLDKIWVALYGTLCCYANFHNFAHR